MKWDPFEDIDLYSCLVAVILAAIGALVVVLVTGEGELGLIVFLFAALPLLFFHEVIGALIRRIYLVYLRLKGINPQTSESYWRSLTGDGDGFQHELANLFLDQGYSVEETGRSGDGNIDLIVRDLRETSIIQCKAHQARIGPGEVQHLYGTLLDPSIRIKADSACLASTSGFTSGAQEKARNMRIQLLEPRQFVEMARKAHGQRRRY